MHLGDVAIFRSIIVGEHEPSSAGGFELCQVDQLSVCL